MEEKLKEINWITFNNSKKINKKQQKKKTQ